MKNLCYTSFVANVGSEKLEVVIGTKVSESTNRRLNQIVESEDRTVSYVVRALLIRGIALYEQDGRLKDDAKHIAPVVARIEGAIDPKEQVRRQFSSQTVPVLKKKAR